MKIEDPVQSAAEILTGASGARITPVAGGGNSKVFCVETKRGRFALKEYPDEADDPRRRRQTEQDALRFLADRQFTDVPVFHTSHERYSLYSWIDGAIVREPDESVLRQALDMWQRLRTVSGVAQAEQFGAAFEACTSLDKFLTQLTMRFERVRAAVARDPEFLDFFQAEMQHRFHEAREYAIETYRREKISSGDIAGAEQQLIHGDYGLHNMLQGADGRMYVLDFEYFGWDDPVKMVADFVLHPGMPLAPSQRDFCLDIALAGGRPPEFAVRLRAQLPLFALRWALITLNPFLAEKGAPLEASETLARWADMKEQQLPKARSLLQACEQMRLR